MVFWGHNTYFNSFSSSHVLPVAVSSLRLYQISELCFFHYKLRIGSPIAIARAGLAKLDRCISEEIAL